MGAVRVFRKIVRKLKRAVSPKVMKENSAASNQNSGNHTRGVNNNLLGELEALNQSNRIDQWWLTEEERIMSDLRKIGKTSN
ncbi:13518_t:CDS:2 [Acaulospora morrowiae]|uniref:13518_t:CDS:1 n=1 Tax=Acaulospora morrowiae TaxID=94023 RepID=A0A9N9NFJ6_9GLOM|nr:13518_t:CDS:2 [Acaulospora morrowiae]